MLNGSAPLQDRRHRYASSIEPTIKTNGRLLNSSAITLFFFSFFFFPFSARGPNAELLHIFSYLKISALSFTITSKAWQHHKVVPASHKPFKSLEASGSFHTAHKAKCRNQFICRDCLSKVLRRCMVSYGTDYGF